MKTADKVKELSDGGYFGQAHRMANAEAVSIQQHTRRPPDISGAVTYTFSDQSIITMGA